MTVLVGASNETHTRFVNSIILSKYRKKKSELAVTFDGEKSGAGHAVADDVISGRARVIGSIAEWIQFGLAPHSHVERKRRLDRLVLIELNTCLK